MAQRPLVPAQTLSVEPRAPTINKYWAAFKRSKPTTSLFPAAVSSVSASASSLAACASHTLQLYDSALKPTRSISRADAGIILACDMRSDGLLVAAGYERDVVRVFDCRSKTNVSSFRLKDSCRAVKFSTAKTRVLAGSDDGRFAEYALDRPDEPVWAREDAHSDYISDVFVSDSNLRITSGYDGLIKGWDARASKAIFAFDLECPAECVAMTSNNVVLAGTNTGVMYALDVAARKTYASVEAHSKTLSCLRTTEDFVLSASLDGSLKAWSRSELACEGTFTYPAPCLSVAFTGKHLVVGLNNKQMVVRRKGRPLRETTASSDGGEIFVAQAAATTSAQKRKMNRTGKADLSSDVVVAPRKAPKTKSYDDKLRKFEFVEALNDVLSKRKPNALCAVVRALESRSALATTIKRLSQAQREDLLSFCATYVKHFKYSDVVVRLARQLLDSRDDDESSLEFGKLRSKVVEEIQIALDSCAVKGLVDIVLD